MSKKFTCLQRHRRRKVGNVDRAEGLTILLFALVILSLPASAAQNHDLVIRGGRVVDPETRLDAVRDVGINGGTIVTGGCTCPLAGPY